MPATAPPVARVFKTTTPLHFPYDHQHLVFHPSVRDMVRRYGERKEIMHTLFYGPPSSGKRAMAHWLVATHTGMPYNAIRQRRVAHSFQLKDRSYPFYKTSVHFEIHVQDYPQQSAIIELLHELAKTRNVAHNTFKIILITDTDLLRRSVQLQLRRMMEMFYATCRLIFVCHALDRIDQTLQSRFVCVRVPAPRREALRWASGPGDGTCDGTETPGEVAPASTTATRPHTVHSWLHAKFADDSGRPLPTIIDQAQDQIWRALQRTSIPIQSLRKWVRLFCTTQLDHTPVVLRLLHKTRAKCSPDRCQRLHAVINYYLYLYETMRNAPHSEIQLELVFCAMHAALHAGAAPSSAFEQIVERCARDGL